MEDREGAYQGEEMVNGLLSKPMQPRDRIPDI